MKSVMGIALFLILNFGMNMALPMKEKMEPNMKFLADGRVERDAQFPRCAHVNKIVG